VTQVLDICTPPTGEALDAARLVAWHVAPGQAFKAGELLVEIETDKSVIEIPAQQDGVMVAHLVDVDGIVNTDTRIARVQVAGGASDDAAASLVSASCATQAAATQTAATDTRQTPTAPPSHPPPSDPVSPPVQISRHVSTPAARRLAAQQGVDWRTLAGSGPNGRVTVADVRQAQPDMSCIASPRQGKAAASTPQEDWVATRHGDVRVTRWNATGRGASADATVVLIHGIFGDRDTWASLAHGLSRAGVRVLALDLPCHGATRAQVTAFEQVVDAVADAVAAQCVGPVVLVGHSFGAAVAARAARRPGMRVQTLLLISPLGLGTEINHGFLHGMCCAASHEAVVRELGKLTASGMVPSAHFVETLRQSKQTRCEALHALCAEIDVDGVQQVYIVPDLIGTSYRCVVIHGRCDAIIPWRHALAAPPETALHLLPDAGHMPQWEASQVVCNIVLAALSA